MTNSELIIKLERMPQKACACAACKSMCRNSPCFPTPQEVKRIIDAGYEDKLVFSMYKNRFIPDRTHVVITGRFDGGRCEFLTDQGLCELHDKGLKPMEGRLAIHSQPQGTGLREAVCRTWRSKAGAIMLKFFYDKYVPEDAKSRV